MPEVPTSCISHVSLGTNNFDRAVAFYDKVMATLGCRRTLEHPGAVAYGHAFPEFWVQVPHDGGRAAAGNGVHVGFLATSRAQVDAFHAAALAAGGTCDGPPGVRPLYGPQYYGAFVRDLDGHKIEAMFWDDSIQA
jgi:catechol 2,3-dioxygenase-like lactoylglutathione lyase family enzyme